MHCVQTVHIVHTPCVLCDGSHFVCFVLPQDARCRWAWQANVFPWQLPTRKARRVALNLYAWPAAGMRSSLYELCADLKGSLRP